MTKTMCQKSKKKRDKVSMKEAKFICKKCKSTAHKEKHLCKPEKI
jgi:hypothetical protein